MNEEEVACVFTTFKEAIEHSKNNSGRRTYFCSEYMNNGLILLEKEAEKLGYKANAIITDANNKGMEYLVRCWSEKSTNKPEWSVTVYATKKSQ